MPIPCPHCTKPIHRVHHCRATLPADPPVPPPPNLRDLVAAARAEYQNLQLPERIYPVVQLELDIPDADPRVIAHTQNRGGRA